MVAVCTSIKNVCRDSSILLVMHDLSFNNEIKITVYGCSTDRTMWEEKIGLCPLVQSYFVSTLMVHDTSRFAHVIEFCGSYSCVRDSVS